MNLYKKITEIKSLGQFFKKVFDFFILILKVVSGQHNEKSWAVKRKKIKDQIHKKITENKAEGQDYYDLALAYLQEDNLVAAKGYFLKAEELGITNENLFLELARIYAKSDEKKIAIEYFEKVKKQGDSTGSGSLELAQLLQRLEDNDRALEEYNSAQKKGNKSKKMNLEKAKILEDKNDFKSAIKMYQSLENTNEETSETHYKLGLLYEKVNDIESAIRELEKAGEMGFQSPERYWELGRMHNIKDDDINAEKYFLLAIENGSKSFVEANFALARIYEERNEYIKSSDYYAKGIEKKYDSEAAYKLIYNLKCAGKWEEIGTVAEKIYKSIPEDDQFIKNIYMNEQEISDNKLVLSSKPRSLTITLTNRCNLKCVMCEVRDAPWEIPESLVNEVKDLFPYLEHVMWQGGEPFVFEEFKEILKYARNFPNMRQVITSNGMMLDDELIEELVKQPDLVLTLSMDGTDKKTFESIRKGADYERFIRNLEIITEKRKEFSSSMRLNLNVTIMKDNYDELTEFIEFAYKYNFFSVFLAPVTGDINNKNNIFYAKSMDELKEMAEEIKKIEELAKGYGLILHNRLPVNEIQSGEFILSEENKNSEDNNKEPEQNNEEAEKNKAPHLIGPLWYDVENPDDRVYLSDKSVNGKPLLCYAPWQRLYVDWWGYVFPDCMCVPEKPAGNVIDKSFSKLWNSKGMQMYRKKMLERTNDNICQRGCLSGRIPERYLRLNR